MINLFIRALRQAWSHGVPSVLAARLPRPSARVQPMPAPVLCELFFRRRAWLSRVRHVCSCISRLGSMIGRMPVDIPLEGFTWTAIAATAVASVVLTVASLLWLGRSSDPFELSLFDSAALWFDRCVITPSYHWLGKFVGRPQPPATLPRGHTTTSDLRHRRRPSRRRRGTRAPRCQRRFHAEPDDVLFRQALRKPLCPSGALWRLQRF